MRLAKTQVFELVITDLIMPEADGLEVIETFKNANNDVRIIAISGGGRIGPESYLNLAKALGARKILAKPFTNAELLSAVQSALHDDEPAPESPVG